MNKAKMTLPEDQIREICRRHRVKELSLFGSSVRGDSRPESDVDLLVEFEPDAEIGFLTLSKMRRELSGILQRPVDLVPKGGIKTKVRDSVLSEARVIYAP